MSGFTCATNSLPFRVDLTFLRGLALELHYRFLRSDLLGEEETEDLENVFF